MDGCKKHCRDPKMSLKDWPLLSDGKRHVLPLALLKQVTRFVHQNTDNAIRQMKSDICAKADGFQPKKKIERKRKRQSSTNEKYDKKKETDVQKHTYRVKASAGSKGSGDHKPQKIRPNFFVSVQVTSPEIRETARRIQSHILEQSEADLKSLVEKVEKMHVTLMVMHLVSPEDILRASSALDTCAASVRATTDGAPVQVDVEGMGNFSKGRVVFACVKDNQGLQLLRFMADEVRKHMQDVGILSTDSRPFNPHLTLMKFQGNSTPKLRKQGVKGVSESLYLPFKEEVFGSQLVSSLQLCQMERKQEDGYYFVAHQSPFA